MITPLDIQNKQFSKGVRGYKEEEVDEFLDMITIDLEKIVKENLRVKAECVSLETELEKYRGSEGAVLETLEAAKSLMGDISVSAEKRAEILLKNAELDAELTVREARESAERLREENIALTNRYTEFREKYRKLLEAELERFDTLTADLFPELDMQDLEDLMEFKKDDTSRKVDTSGKDETSKKDAVTTETREKPVDTNDNQKTMVNIKPIGSET